MGKYQDENPDGKTRVGGWLSTLGGFFTSDKEDKEESDKQGFFKNVVGFFSPKNSEDGTIKKSGWQTVSDSFMAASSFVGDLQRNEADMSAQGRIDTEKIDLWVTGGNKVYNGIAGWINGSQTRVKLTQERIKGHVTELKRSKYSLVGVNKFMHDMNSLYHWERKKKHSAAELVWQVIEPMTNGLLDMGFEYEFRKDKNNAGYYEYPVYSKSTKSVAELKFLEDESNVFQDSYSNLASSMQGSAFDWVKVLAVAGGGYMLFKFMKKGKGKSSIKGKFQKLLK